MSEAEVRRFADGVVRRARPDDMDALVGLCGEHARYERAPCEPAGYPSEGKPDALARALFSQPARLHAWVARWHGELVGYATASPEFSTWQVREYLHMDCLFVREGRRGSGIGAALLGAVVDFARHQGFIEIQWQTPDWNTDAMRFYRRAGAVGRPKQRFFLEP